MAKRENSISGATALEIADSIEAAIRGGIFNPGSRLPPIRKLADDLAVSHVTAAAAYRRLRERGLVTGVGRAGTRVAVRPPLRLRLTTPIPRDGLDLESGNPDLALLPPLPSIKHRHTLYGTQAQDSGLMRLVEDGLAADGIPAQQLTILGGTLDAIERVLTVYLRPGDRVAVEDPGYPRLFDLLPALRLTPEPIAVDELGVRPESLAAALARGVEAVVLTPRAQNPTGAAVDAGRAAELMAVLERYPDTLVIEDDHADGVAGAPMHSLAGTTTRWVFVRSFGMSLSPDLRVAAVAGDEVTMTRVEGRQMVGSGWVSHILQRTTASLLASSETRKLVGRAERAYRKRREALIAALSDLGLSASGRSGLSVWVPVAEEAVVIRGLLAAGYAVSAGERFRLASPPAVRIAVSRLHPEQAPALAAALAAIVHPRARTYSA